MAALLVVATVSGCGSADGNAGRAPKPVETSAADRLGPKVELLDAGEAPRQTVRFTLHPGDKTHRTMTMDMTMAMGIDGAPARTITVPSMSMGMALEVTDVGDETASTTFRYDDVYVDGSGADAHELEKKLDPIVGLTGTFRSTGRGAVVDSDVTIPDDLDPAMRSTLSSFDSQMENLSVPFPVESVGVGARWKVRTHAELNGIRTEATYVYRLVSRRGDRVVLDFTIEQDAPEQDPHLPGMPSGASAHVREMGGSGSGRVVIDLGSQLPLTMTSSSKVHSEMSIEQEGHSQDLVQDMRMKVSLDSKRRVGAPA